MCRGAKIHSDSWGTGSSAYDALAYDVDLFSYVNQDFLPVFAAGNFGCEEVDSTVTSPSVSKNCLSVGKPIFSLLPLISYLSVIEESSAPVFVIADQEAAYCCVTTIKNPYFD